LQHDPPLEKHERQRSTVFKSFDITG